DVVPQFETGPDVGHERTQVLLRLAELVLHAAQPGMFGEPFSLSTHSPAAARRPWAVASTAWHKFARLATRSWHFRPDARFGLARCYSLAADEAEAVLVDAAGAVAGGKEVQLVDHVVVAAYEGLIDPCPLQDRQFEGSFQEPPALPVVNKICVAVGEPHRKRAPGDVIGPHVPVELEVEGADRLVGVLASRSSLNRIDPRC